MLSNKIILEALNLKGFQNPTAIAEILNYVPNPNVALEMLLGIHEPKVVNIETSFRKYRHTRDSIYEITGYDELGDKVIYAEYKQKTIPVYYLTREDAQNKEVYELERPKGDYYSSGTIPDSGYIVTPNQSMNTADFESAYGTVVPLSEAGSLIVSWECYNNIEKPVLVNEL